MTAKEFLSLYKSTEQELAEMDEKIMRLKSKAEKVTPTYGGIGGASGGMNSDKIPTYVCLIMDEEARTQDHRNEINQIRADVEHAIYAVSDGTARTLLIMRYISGRTWEQIAVSMHYSYVHVVHRLHPVALELVKVPEKYKM